MAPLVAAIHDPHESVLVRETDAVAVEARGDN
jgi:hypothetical protein